MIAALIEQIRKRLSGHSFPSLTLFSYVEGNGEELSGYKYNLGGQPGSSVCTWA